MKRLIIFLIGLMLLNSLAFAEGTKILGFGKHLKFGDVAVGDSVTRELTLYNRGDTDLTIFELYFHESLYGVYTGNFSGTIPPNGEQNVTITFSPTSNTLSQGSVYVVSDKTNRGDSSRSLIGQGIGADIDVTRKLGFGKHLKFGDVAVGDSETRELTLYNRGNADLTISELYFHESLDGVYSGNFSGTIPPNGEQNVTITFSPISDTFSQGSVYVVSDKTNSGDSSRSLTGQGVGGGDSCDGSTALTKGELRDMIVQGMDVTGVNTCMIIDMSNLFLGQSNFNQDISGWDTSRVKNMYSMFKGASSFNQSIGEWDVSNVRNMNGMFYGASLFNQPIGEWDVSNVRNMVQMFSYASSFNQPIGEWDISSVVEMGEMFYYARSFNQNIKNWGISSVEYFYEFSEYSKLEDKYNPFILSINAGVDKTVVIDSVVRLVGIAEENQWEQIYSYEWREGNTVLATTFSFNYIPTTIGSHTLTFIVGYNYDEYISMDSVKIEVIGNN